MRFTFPSGATPLEGYTIKRGLGIGGFGEVYFAISHSGKEVALKRISRNLEVELRGVRQCLNLKHANLIGLWDIQIDDHGESWVVMEYVAGPSLRDVVEAHPNGLNGDDLVWWFQGICAGVHYLHQNGIVHRDLKPGNIFQDNEAQLVKIGDYGLSKFISCSRRSGHTESVGTVHYMAPEIGRGIYGREIDVYSLGIILHELVTGRVPFEGESSQEIIMKHLTATPDVSALPRPLDQVVLRAMAKDPQHRYGSVLDMLSDLPEEFWPPSIKRTIQGSLSDTASHPGIPPSSGTSPENGSGGSMADSPAPLSVDGSSVQAENTSSGAPAAAVTLNRTPAIMGKHRFNRPPAPVWHSEETSGQAGSTSREAQNRTASPTLVPPGAATTGDGQQPNVQPAACGETLRRQLLISQQPVIFGEVQFHDVVDAEMVFSEPVATRDPEGPGLAVQPQSQGGATPTEKVGTWAGVRPLPHGRLADGKLSRKERIALSEDPRVHGAAKQYLQLISGSDQLEKLLSGMLWSSGVAALVMMLAANTILPGRLGNFWKSDAFALSVWLWIVAFGTSWLLLSGSRLWPPGGVVSGWRTWLPLPLAVGAAGLAWGLAEGMGIPVAKVVPGTGITDRGALGWLLFRDGNPGLLSYCLFFLALMFWGGWPRQTDPLRVRRVRIRSLLWVVLLAGALSLVLNISPLVAGLLGLTISLSTQVGATYFSDRQRLEVRDSALRSYV